mgnify:CR=1 FL=1
MSDGTIDLTVLTGNNSAPTKGEFKINFGSGDKLVGTFTGSVFPVDTNGIARFVLSYTVTGGMGLFAGALGSGNRIWFLDEAIDLEAASKRFAPADIAIPGMWRVGHDP